MKAPAVVELEFLGALHGMSWRSNATTLVYRFSTLWKEAMRFAK